MSFLASLPAYCHTQSLGEMSTIYMNPLGENKYKLHTWSLMDSALDTWFQSVFFQYNKLQLRV